MSLMPGSAAHTNARTDDVAVHSLANLAPTQRTAEIRSVLETTTAIPPVRARELEKCVRIGGVSDRAPPRLVRLTPREVEALKLLARGHSNKLID